VTCKRRVDRAAPHNSLRDCLAESQNMAIAIAHGEFVNPIVFLIDRTIHNVGPTREQFCVQRIGIVDSREWVSGAPLLFVWASVIGGIAATEHDCPAVVTDNRELRRDTGDVVSSESDYRIRECR
jgi:hypothetical protein